MIQKIGRFTPRMSATAEASAGSESGSTIHGCVKKSPGQPPILSPSRSKVAPRRGAMKNVAAKRIRRVTIKKTPLTRPATATLFLSAMAVEDVVEELEPALPVVSTRGILRGGGGGGGGGGEVVMPSVSAE
jgi:hypothetical protein